MSNENEKVEATSQPPAGYHTGVMPSEEVVDSVTEEAEAKRRPEETTMDEILEATVGAKIKYPSANVEIAPGVFIEVRALSYEEKKEVHGQAVGWKWPKGMSRQKAASKELLEPDFDQTGYELGLLMECCFKPGSDQKCFGPQHIATFKKQPAHEGHWLHKLIDKATELNKAGNLETTPSD